MVLKTQFVFSMDKTSLLIFSDRIARFFDLHAERQNLSSLTFRNICLNFVNFEISINSFKNEKTANLFDRQH